MEINKNIILLFGPTAIGKSNLALKLAKENYGVIFNADSMQIYKELPILSSQPSKNDQNQVKHFLYGFLNYYEDFSVVKWLEKITPIIKEQINDGKKCFITGGTGLYFSSLYYGINKIPKISENNRIKTRNLYKKIGKEKFIKYLKDLGDFNIEMLDSQRLIRRAEILEETGKNLKFWQEQDKEIFFEKDQFQIIKLLPAREIIYQKCEERFKYILENNVVEEVKNLMELKIDKNYLITKTLGYKEIESYIENKITKEELIKIATKRIRNYAKRQLTWFRNQF